MMLGVENKKKTDRKQGCKISLGIGEARIQGDVKGSSSWDTLKINHNYLKTEWQKFHIFFQRK